MACLATRGHRVARSPHRTHPYRRERRPVAKPYLRESSRKEFRPNLALSNHPRTTTCRLDLTWGLIWNGPREMANVGVYRAVGTARCPDGESSGVEGGSQSSHSSRSHPVKAPSGVRFLRITNPSQADIVIREVIFQPEVYALALSGGPDLLCRLASTTPNRFVISDRPSKLRSKVQCDHRSVAQGEGEVVPQILPPLDLQGGSASTAEQHSGEHWIVTASNGNPACVRELSSQAGVLPLCKSHKDAMSCERE